MKKRGIAVNPQTGDLQVQNGTLRLGDVTAQNQAFIIGSYAGAYKLAPTVGVGIADALNDEDPLLWRTEIAKQLRADGQVVHSIQITSTDMIINANYPSE